MDFMTVKIAVPLWLIILLFSALLFIFALLFFYIRNSKTKYSETTNRLKDLLTENEFLIDLMPVYFYVEDVNDNFRHIKCNKICAELWGRPIEEVLGRSDEELFPNVEEVRVFRETDRAAAATVGLHEDVLAFTGHDGRRHVGRFYRRCLNMSDGRRWLFGIVVDVTAEHDQSARLDAAMNAFEYTFDLTRTAIFRYDPQTFEMKGASNLNTHWPIHQGKGAAFSEVVLPEDLPNFQSNISDLIDQKVKRVTIEYRSKCSGDLRYYRLSAGLDTITDGRMTVVGIIQDVTEIAQNSAQLKEGRALWQQVINNIPVQVFVKNADRDFCYEQVNRAFTAFIGLPEESLIGHTDVELFSNGAIADLLREKNLAAMETEDGIQFEAEIYDASHMPQRLRLLFKPFIRADGSRLLLGVAENITFLSTMLQFEHINNEVLTHTVGEPDFVPVVMNILDTTRRTLRCDYVFFAHCLEGKSFQIFREVHSVNSEPMDELIQEACITFWNAALERLRRGEVVLFDRLRKDFSITSFFTDHPNYLTCTFGAVPVFIADELFGILMVVYKTEYTFNPSDEQILRSMGEIVSIAGIRDNQNSIVREAERLNQMILDNINLPVWLFDPQGRIIRFNRASIELTNISTYSDTPYQCRDLFQCEISEEECPIRLALKDGQPHQCNYRYNSDRYFIIDVRPVRNEQGTIVYLVKTAFEMTKMRTLIANRDIVNECLANLLREGNMHIAINKSLKKVCEHAGATRCYIFQFNSQQRTFSCFTEYYETGEEPVFARFQNQPYLARIDWETLFENQEMLSFPDLQREMYDEGLEEWAQLIIQYNARSLYAYRIRLDDKFWGYVGLLYTNETHSLTKENSDFLASVAQCIELMLIRQRFQTTVMDALEKAKAADRAKGMFLASMSHEIRTPLNAVIGFAELLKDGVFSPAEQTEYLTGIALAGNALLSLINDVLDLSKLEASQMVFTSSAFDFPALIADTELIFKQKCAEKKIKFHIETSPDMPWIQCDKLRLRQMLFNLIGNAVKFTDSGSITVRAKFTPYGTKTGRLSFSVIDTGIGIAPEDQEKVFELFVQAKQSRTASASTKGTGLGLALVKRLAEHMHGRVSLESCLGKGSDFTVELDDIPYMPPVIVESIQAPPPPIPEGLCVLIVDDIQLNLNVMEAMLKKIGVRSEIAINATEAWEKLESMSFDAMLTDLWMPGLNGADLATKIRHSGRWPNLKIAAVTADVEGGSCLDMSVFDAVLTKPITVNGLRLLLAGFMEKKKTETVS